MVYISTVSDVKTHPDHALPALAVGDGRGRLLAAEDLHGLDRLLLRHAVVKKRSNRFILGWFGGTILDREMAISKNTILLRNLP